MPIPRDIIIGLDNNVPVIEGECPTCKRGKRSLVIVNYVPSSKHEESDVYMRCVCCFSFYKTKVKYVAE